VPLGAVVEVWSGVTRVGTKSLSVRSEIRAADTGRVHSRMMTVLVHFDLHARKSIALDEDTRRRANELLVSEDADGA
jgi:acyl-CoA thioesterase FadM